MDLEGRLETLSYCPHVEIWSSRDIRKHRWTMLPHSHSIVAGGFDDTS
jgi:hypothetical protein